MENNFKRITAVLGPTNTGKTHLAVETMLSFESGIMGFPTKTRKIYGLCFSLFNLKGIEYIHRQVQGH